MAILDRTASMSSSGDAAAVFETPGLPENVVDLLKATHKWVDDIVDIEVLRSSETNLAKIIARVLFKDYIVNWILWVPPDPVVSDRITRTLQRYRQTTNQ